MRRKDKDTVGRRGETQLGEGEGHSWEKERNKRGEKEIVIGHDRNGLTCVANMTKYVLHFNGCS